MSARYLLPCECGRSTPVSPSQAGGTVACECGQTLDVPRLGELRSLPTKSESAAPGGKGWSFRLGVGSGALVAALILGGLAAWVAANEPAPPAPFDPTARQTFVDRQLDASSPAELWRLLKTVYEPLADTGLVKVEPPINKRIEELIAMSSAFQFGLSVAAGAAAVLAVVAFVALPK